MSSSAAADAAATAATTSSLSEALKSAHARRVFTPAQLPPPEDISALHDRIAAYRSAAAPITTAGAPDALARLAQLLDSSKATVAAAAAARRSLAGSRSDDGETPAVAAFRAQVGPGVFGRKREYTVAQPPSQPTEAEVQRAVAALTPAERAALEREFQLTYVEGFELLSCRAHSDDDDDDEHAGVAVDSDDEGEGEGEGVSASAHSHRGQQAGAPTVTFSLEPIAETAATAAGGADAAANDSGAACTVEVKYAQEVDWGGSAAASQPSLSAAHRSSGREGAGDDSAAAAGATAAATWAASGNVLTVPDFAQWARRPGGAAGAPHHEDDEETTDDGIESVPLSFAQFSRMRLGQMDPVTGAAGEGRQSEAPPPPLEPTGTAPAPAAAPTAPTPSKPHHPGKTQKQKQRAVTEPESAAAAAAAAAAALAREREHFIHQRVRDILVANRAVARERDAMAAALLQETHGKVAAAVKPALPTCERLLVLAAEADVLLHAVEKMERAAIGAQLRDPALFLTVPRLRTTCYNTACKTPFSIVAPRSMCGRCGQLFCPRCCRFRGLGPSVVCDGRPVSLGWEPLCEVCFRRCEDSQRAVAQERRRRRLLAHSAEPVASSEPHAAVSNGVSSANAGVAPLVPNIIFSSSSSSYDPTSGVFTVGGPSPIYEDGSVSDGDEDDAAAQAAQRFSDVAAAATVTVADSTGAARNVDDLTVKEAVLLGAYCRAGHVLEDGLPPFYVAGSDDTAPAWDRMSYRLARLRGSLFANYQRAGTAARNAVADAANAAATRAGRPRRAIAAAAPAAAAATEREEPSSEGAVRAES